VIPERRSAIIQSVLFLLVAGALLFGAAGRFDIWNFWCYLAIFAGVFMLSLATIDPSLIRERMRPAGRRTPMALYVATAGMFVELALAGLDRGRFHWSDTVPRALIVAGLVLFVLTNVAFLWIMRVNPYFSSAVRIQRDRGQTVISSGPYAWVRHPGYAAAFILMPANGLALGSWIAAAIALLGLPWLLWRTIGEDRMLRAELDGYEDYMRRVRWRLLPGVW
jgi:protein-S-isoprenylcysteine O-methyltransferase Ste14